MLEFFSPDEEVTARLAAQIASRAQSGDVFALYGTLGMGDRKSTRLNSSHRL